MAKLAQVVGLTAAGRRIVAASSPSVIGAARSALARTRPAPPPRQTLPAPPAQPTYPIHLFAEADVASGSETTMRSQALANRTGKPLEIREIRFGAIAIGGVAANVRMDAGGLLRFSLDVGGKPITHGYVPMWALGKTEDLIGQLSYPTAGTSYGPWASYVWRLSRPWYLKPGAVVGAQLQHTGASKFAVTGQIGLVGRAAVKPATTSAVPYACAWASKPIKDSDTAIEESAETDLLNVTKRTVSVDRIVGRVAARYTTASGSWLTLTHLSGFSSDFGGLNLKLFTSDHRPITQDFFGVTETFGPRRAIEVAHPFAAGDFYRVSLQKTAAFVSGVNDYYAQAFVSVLGCREEPL